MAYIDLLIQTVDKSDLSPLQKNVMKGFIKRSYEEEDKRTSDRTVIEKYANEKRQFEVVFSSDYLKIYKVSGNEEWDIKFPYRSIFLNNKEQWEKTNTVSPSFDVAFLVYLEKKHLGSNSQFVDFALKMLEIKIEE